MKFEQKRFKDLIKLKSGDLVDKSTSEGCYPIYGANGVIGSINKKNIKNSTLLIGRVGSAGAINIASDGFASDNVLIVKIKNNNSMKYIYYFLSIFNFSDIISKTSQPLLVSSKLLRSAIDIPNLKNQESIVSYLDKETSKIDRKISILEQKFAKLEEYKQSVIFETVTKGLDSNVPMKDSGIDWIGEIPKHCEFKRVKEVLNPLNKSDIQSGDSELDGVYDFYISGAKTKKINKTNLHQIALLLPTGGTYMVHFPKNVPCAYSTDVLPLVTKSLLNIKYGFYFLNANREYFNQSYFSGTGIKHLQREEFFNSLITIPSKNEQDEITCYLDLVCLKIDKKKEIIKKQIELLKEYKQTIIYEAVTGKMDIL